MNVNLNTINGMESDLDRPLKSMDAGQIYTSAYQKNGNVKGAFAVDLNGNFLNNQAYANNGKTKNDIIAEAQNTDTAVRHNYMSIMANNMSADDFAKAAADGFDFGEMSPEESVTILDKIKATLAVSGTEIIGYTDDLSAKELEQITGSSGLANEIASSFHENDIPLTQENVKEIVAAIDKIKDITAISDGALKYMTLNNMEPTIDNIYMAEHATNGQNRKTGTYIALETEGYYGTKAEKLEWDAVEDQVKRIIDESGLDSSDKKNLEEARWMIEEGIPLTTDNVKKVHELGSIELPISEEEIVKLTAVSISNRNAAVINDNTESNNLLKAIEIADEVTNISDKAIERVLSEDKVLNIENLSAEQKDLDNDKKAGTDKALSDEHRLPMPEDTVSSEKNVIENVNREFVNHPEEAGNNDERREFLEARKQLEEIRLSMTVSANLRLLDKGFKLETEPIKQVIEALTKEIESLGNELFSEEDSSKYLLFEETTAKVAELKLFPVDIAGRDNLLESENFGDIYQEAKTLKQRYDKAGKTYEAVGTEVRADLGDNIKKAFRNIDTLLKDQGQEINEENRRAVRILGYNHMEITKENIESVRTIDEKLMNTVNKLKPGAVLNMIRDGHNPLKMTINELSDELGRQDKGDSSKQEEKYSRFLYKLEKNAEITPEEKETYIGIYRLFHNLKITDNAAIGVVLETGAEMTIENLLSATRTLKKEKKGLDYKVDDDFGGLIGRDTDSKSISSQIESAFMHYSESADIVYQNLEPEKLLKADAKEEMLLDELAEKLAMEETSLEGQSAEKEYYSEKAKEMRKIAALQSTDEIVTELEKHGIAANTDMVQALINLKSGRKGRNNSVWSLAEKMATLAFKEVRQEMLQDLIDSDDYESAYEEKLMGLSESLNELLMEEADSYIDVKTIHLMQKQLTVASKMSKQESYEIPVEIDGRLVSMHVTFKENELDGSRVEAEIETPDFGQVSMAMTVSENKVIGAFASAYRQTEDLSEYLSDVKEKFIRGLSEKEENLSVEPENIGVFYRRQEAGSAVTGSGNGVFDKRTLLRMAEIFVHSV
ncbi:DUF6240 domain-containing protein [Butyrivibrio sp. LC3010]|uniref:DUF6240 domain-containing protein n=1 Tax=Butyrivibrio sp. LC3010 TaxID=1280680 RepID=UPI0003F8FDEC|nr:DUF6240 domain-containing protein [Butyrivibrio sp. LC3010]